MLFEACDYFSVARSNAGAYFLGVGFAESKGSSGLGR
jgi:hypothetical protein